MIKRERKRKSKTKR